MHNVQIEQLKRFETSRVEIQNALNSIDTILYYIQYKKKPYTPFVRPLSD